MNTTADTSNHNSLVAHSRVNIYRSIHKGIRAFMCNTLVKVASLDLQDAKELEQVLNQTRELAAFCADHLRHEDDFVHPAMEARQPGSSGVTAGDHVHHSEAIERIENLVNAVQQASGEEQAIALSELQQQLELFIAENFEHMHFEETHNNSVLWANYSDSEIMGIEQAIVASLSPADFATCMRWILTGMSPAERADMLGGIRSNAPAAVFDTVWDIACDCLKGRDLEKLTKSLSLDMPQAA